MTIEEYKQKIMEKYGTKDYHPPKDFDKNKINLLYQSAPMSEDNKQAMKERMLEKYGVKEPINIRLKCIT